MNVCMFFVTGSRSLEKTTESYWLCDGRLKIQIKITRFPLTDRYVCIEQNKKILNPSCYINYLCLLKITFFFAFEERLIYLKIRQKLKILFGD